MKVRTKFTLWISLASLTATIVFTAFIFDETTEELTEFVDQELADIAENIFSVIELQHDPPQKIPPQAISYPIDHYWLKVTDKAGTTLLATKLAGFAELPLPENKPGIMVTRDIPHEQLSIPPEGEEDLEGLAIEKVKLRVRFFTRTLHNTEYAVQIAKPLLLVDAEIKEILRELGVGVVVTIFVILFVAYFVAGKLLDPLATINSMIREIRENSLDMRIPVGKSRDELHSLTVSLNSMFDRLEHSFKEQKDFISNASHELKSPLTVLMLGHEEMLCGSLPKEIRSELEKQLHSMRRLNKLIRDLLSIARLEQQESLDRETVVLDELIETTLGEYSEMLKSKRIRVTNSTTQIAVLGDRDKLHRLFINLIDNAIKYNFDHDGNIDIQTAKDGNTVIVTVTNSGQAIPTEDLPLLFKQFHRVEKSRSCAYGGAGLGLTIAKRIAQLHSGELEVVNANHITSFRIILPALS